MANVAITPASFKLSTIGLQNKLPGISGAAFVAGDLLGQDPTSLKLAPFDNDSGDDVCVGFAACSCPGADQPCFYTPIDPDCTLGGTVVQGTIYVASSTAGLICPAADLGSADNVVYVGTGRASNHLEIYVRNSGQAVP